MRAKQIFIGFVVWTMSLIFSSTVINAKEFDYSKVKKLKGMELIEYFNSLGIKDQDALNFWINIPVSKANKCMTDFKKRAFNFILTSIPPRQVMEDISLKWAWVQRLSAL